MIFGLGMVELGVTFSFEQLVFDDIMIENIKSMINNNMEFERLDDLVGLTREAEKGFQLRSWSSNRNKVQDISYRLNKIISRHRPQPLQKSVIHEIREIIQDTEERKVREAKGC